MLVLISLVVAILVIAGYVFTHEAFIPNPSLGPEWKLVATGSDGSTFYVNTKRITYLPGGIVKFWELWVPRGEMRREEVNALKNTLIFERLFKGVDPNNAERLWYKINLTKFNCETHQYAPLEEIDYSFERVDLYSHSFQDEEWKYIPPGSVGEKIEKYVCKKYRSAEKDRSAEEPRPLGLILGKTTKEEAISILKKEGGKITNSGYRIIKGDISNPSVEGIDFTGLPIKDLKNAKFWFFHKILFQIVYTFHSKDEFYVMYKELVSKYGNPSKYVKPGFTDGLAVWEFGNVEIMLKAPFISWDTYVTYTYLPLSEKAQQSDNEVFTKETAKPQIGL